MVRLFNRRRVMALPARPPRQRAVWVFWSVIIAAVLVIDGILIALLVASG